MNNNGLLAGLLKDYLQNSTDSLPVEIRNLSAETPILSSSGTLHNGSRIEDWFDNQDVMQILHISTRTLQKLRTNGTLPYSRIGKKIYYHRHDIIKILSTHYSSNNGNIK